ncbi:factor VIII intron 22 protein-like [Anoplophora glabripennis]|uniref:factor VIII intron 22 protein-like n=1 Tax=Anoplophora glabripennis TaxID=217634 RepID=UPI0008735756|nr:factor VIII intron 22 protein-like [Anoplophora glabripennis]
MSETTGSEILDQYRNISIKLKKRFLRKPNVTEACESFVSLAKQCETLELPAYAGLCWIAAARCEGSLSNNTGETSCLVQSGRQFLKAEENDFNLGCSSVSGENLQAGLSCYTHASSRFPDNCSIPIGLNLELTEFLKKIDRTEYIQSYLENAIELSEGRSDTNIYCLELMASHFVDRGDYLAALETYLEMFRLLKQLPINGSRCETLLKCEIYCVFLLLILRPSPQKLSANLAKILEKYTWGDKNDTSLKACKMTDNMFLLLQSLVTICQSLDTTGLIDLESEFWPLLSKQQKELLRILVRSYC